MFQRQLFSWAFTLILLTSSLRAQEAVIGSRDSFAGQPTPATQVPTGHKHAVHAVAISPDMKTIVSGGGENEMPIIGKQGQKLNISDSDKDAAERVQGEGVIWEWKPAKRRFLLHPWGRIKGLTFTPDGKVIGGYLEKAPLFRGYNIPGNPVLFYDAKTGKGVGQFSEGDVLNTPKALSFSEDGLVVVVAGGFHDPERSRVQFGGVFLKFQH